MKITAPLFLVLLVACPALAAEPLPPPAPLPPPTSNPPQILPQENGNRLEQVSTPAPVPINLAMALQWTLTQNPNLVTIRQDIPVSAEAWAVAQRFPTSLNPTVSLDVRPWVYETAPDGGVRQMQTLVNVSWSQPIELGRRTALRASIAHANFDQTRYTVLQAELTALVQTYRLHETALYRRDKLKVARALVEFDGRLVETLQRQVEAGRAAAADLVLAQVEHQSTRQQLEIATHEYVAALSDLRIQLGIPEYAASAAPCDDVQLPVPIPAQDDAVLVRMALCNRPEILAAQAAVSGSREAVALARADRISIFSVGPMYEKDESGVSFYGLTAGMPMPILNDGKPLVRQREAEHQRNCVALAQLQRRTTAQVRATLVKWHDAQDLVRRTQALVEPVRDQTTRMEHLYAAGESDIIKLLQVRLRLLDTENGRLDALWAATQSNADLLEAVGAISLLGGLIQNAEAIPAPRLP
jgi:outer membrane protein, heavy metal efflux system